MLPPGNGVQRMSERRPATAFDLYKGDKSVSFHHEIDFFPVESHITVKDPPTRLNQVTLSQGLEAAPATYGIQGSGISRSRVEGDFD